MTYEEFLRNVADLLRSQWLIRERKIDLPNVVVSLRGSDNVLDGLLEGKLHHERIVLVRSKRRPVIVSHLISRGSSIEHCLSESFGLQRCTMDALMKGEMRSIIQPQMLDRVNGTSIQQQVVVCRFTDAVFERARCVFVHAIWQGWRYESIAGTFLLAVALSRICRRHEYNLTYVRHHGVHLCEPVIATVVYWQFTTKLTCHEYLACRTR
jgi:hypothetical protein